MQKKRSATCLTKLFRTHFAVKKSFANSQNPIFRKKKFSLLF